MGIAATASHGALTSAQLDARPVMRAGEVLETVPGLIVSQHSGEGKANQYYLRGFNLGHGTDARGWPIAAQRDACAALAPATLRRVDETCL